MPSKNIINVKDRVMNDEIDLSMSELVEIPVKDIASFKKATSLDVSNNNIKLLPKNFVTLIHLTKLDLSRNNITELPENFGDLCKLRHLDLYQNQLQYLPLSFCKLKALRWLDLKNNPLKPAIAKVAGPCLDTKDCQACARNIVIFYTSMQEKVNIEAENRDKQRKKQLEINTQKDKKEKSNKKKNKQKTIMNNQESKSKSIEGDNTFKSEQVKYIPDEDLKHVKFSFCYSFFVPFITLLLLLFIISSLNYKYSEIIKHNVIITYKTGLEYLPNDYKLYGLKFGDHIYHIHEKTGKFTQNLMNKISKDNFVKIYESILPAINSIINKVRDFLKIY